MPLCSAAAAIRPAYEKAAAAHASLATLAEDDAARSRHLALLDRIPDRPRGHVDTIEAMAAAKIEEADTIEEAVSFMTPPERSMVLATPSLLARLVALPPA